MLFLLWLLFLLVGCRRGFRPWAQVWQWHRSPANALAVGVVGAVFGVRICGSGGRIACGGVHSLLWVVAMVVVSVVLKVSSTFVLRVPWPGSVVVGGHAQLRARREEEEGRVQHEWAGIGPICMLPDRRQG